MAYGSYTDYLEMLAAQPLDKLALVDDAASFTYGQLVAEAKKLRSSTTMDEPAVFIHEDTIAQQLLKFVVETVAEELIMLKVVSKTFLN